MELIGKKEGILPCFFPIDLFRNLVSKDVNESTLVKKKHSLTLLEVIIAITLLGLLLTGLFNCFHQGLKKNISAKELKQKVLQLELFQQRLKNLFSNLDGEAGLSLEKHPDAYGLALIVFYKQSIDPEFDMCGTLQGMVFVNKNKELCLTSWSEKGKARNEILLDKIDTFTCRLFDPKKAEWAETWSTKNEEDPVMIAIDLKWEGKEMPFVFFLSESNQKITYPISP
jgi:type II secretory pathway pseudopilin PulG